ncbi:MAG: hypothetical protein K8F62_11475 [Pseudorhodoplanes sp.]|nr:hypothetical protein [Pseudorhodoplanes sp.]
MALRYSVSHAANEQIAPEGFWSRTAEEVLPLFAEFVDAEIRQSRDLGIELCWIK